MSCLKGGEPSGGSYAPEGTYNVHMYAHVSTQRTVQYVIVARPRQDSMAMLGCHAVLSGSCNYFVIPSTHFIWYFNSIRTC